jgi:protein gp37
LVQGGRFTGKLLFDPQHLYAVLKAKNPKRIFVNEFSDLLHEGLPLKVVIEHVRVFRAASWHQFQVLTSSERLADTNEAVLSRFGRWPANLWLGVSVCSAEEIEMKRIADLGASAAAVRWISFEPWVSDVNCPLRKSRPKLRKLLRRHRIAWTVVGGESGSKNDTNLMTLDDAQYLIEESRAAGSRVHFKQLGTALAIRLPVYTTSGRAEHRSKGGSPDQWPSELNLRERPDPNQDSDSEAEEFAPGFDAKKCLHYQP